MSAFTVGGFSREVADLLEERACAEGITVDSLIRRLIHQGLGLSPHDAEPFDELDSPDVDWSDGDTKDFLRRVGVFEDVPDDESWA